MLQILICSEWRQMLGISDSRSSGVLCNSKYKEAKLAGGKQHIQKLL